MRGGEDDRMGRCQDKKMCGWEDGKWEEEGRKDGIDR
jgi:hypothetical protein